MLNRLFTGQSPFKSATFGLLALLCIVTAAQPASAVTSLYFLWSPYATIHEAPNNQDMVAGLERWRVSLGKIAAENAKSGEENFSFTGTDKSLNSVDQTIAYYKKIAAAMRENMQTKTPVTFDLVITTHGWPDAIGVPSNSRACDIVPYDQLAIVLKQMFEYFSNPNFTVHLHIAACSSGGFLNSVIKETKTKTKLFVTTNSDDSNSTRIQHQSYFTALEITQNELRQGRLKESEKSQFHYQVFQLLQTGWNEEDVRRSTFGKFWSNVKLRPISQSAILATYLDGFDASVLDKTFKLLIATPEVTAALIRDLQRNDYREKVLLNVLKAEVIEGYTYEPNEIFSEENVGHEERFNYSNITVARFLHRTYYPLKRSCERLLKIKVLEKEDIAN